MFRKVTPGDKALSFHFEGGVCSAEPGDTVALALLVAGIDSCRDSVVSGQPRGPYCLMGACFECLVVIDGVQNLQGCQVQVREGMVVTRQRGGRHALGDTLS
ncbi:(2Fe-2S)-binding protein [Pseudomonas typographi]|uniref:(2Fe-2S)-binding protein n=1 Tax=Pseudomonas typographi TaxID=2715964 RepID=A0ABR7Z239_9PSED|nr:(2Fe-2S)-binding protein [Pseudomonas typographi]MBD1551559.1 (2Fe-2S)-binding protein [Pseudomonas typographi]MBD1587455.1 (2Fe-2S)-binding protein [Pseudomonas typographi]MBD1599463.1 (2Fe-2S)-binding protein [Pseudomonas typographi]